MAQDSIGKRISSLRKSHNMTQEDLSKQLGVTPQAISKWENDITVPDIALIPKIADFFGVTTDFILGKEDNIMKDNNENEFYEDENKDTRTAFISIEKLAFPLTVILFGVALLWRYVFKVDVSVWNLIWPVAILGLLGFGSLRSKSKAFPIGAILVGGYFLLSNLKIINIAIGWEIVIPVLLIIWGVGMAADVFVYKKNGTKKNSGKEKFSWTSEDGYVEGSFAFTDRTVPLVGNHFKGGDISASFSEVKLDLTQAKTADDGATLDLNASFGEVTVLLPKHIVARISESTSFGEVKVIGTPDSNATAHINIEANSSFGGIKIIYK